MKTLLASLLFFGLLATHVHAKILTVSNVAGSKAMYTNPQLAIDATTVGDTVFLHASATSYSDVTIKRRIVLMGEGGKPNYTGVTSRVGTVTIDSLEGVKVSGTIVVGIHMNYLYLDNNYNRGVKGVVIKNCYIDYSANIGGSGHIIANNIMYSCYGLGSNTTFSNNIVKLSVGNGTNCVIMNNVFISGSGNYSFYSLSNCSIVNNIIIHALTAISTSYPGVGNAYSKNIQAGTDLPTGNFKGIQPLDVFSETTILASMSSAQFLTARWTQLTTSEGKNAGTDGKDVGVYGGSFSWPSNKVFNGDPGLPQITSSEIQNAVIAPNGTLLVNFKAKSAKTK
ncbi:MAG TPA: hypothetical protein DCR46_05145 [Cytophagales bacterium]|nr:hypothetical protein [Cytophagales bacterium]